MYELIPVLFLRIGIFIVCLFATILLLGLTNVIPVESYIPGMTGLLLGLMITVMCWRDLRK